MRTRTFTIGAIVLFSAVLAVFSGCRHHSGSHEKQAEKMIRYLTDELSLTESQQAVLMNFKDDMLKKRDDAQQFREKNKAIVMEELKKDTIDQERLMNIYLEHKPKMDELAEFVVSSLSEFHQTLTPEQKSILIAKLETFDKWHSYFGE